jgi:hypothetical protein
METIQINSFDTAYVLSTNGVIGTFFLDYLTSPVESIHSTSRENILKAMSARILQLDVDSNFVFSHNKSDVFVLRYDREYNLYYIEDYYTKVKRTNLYKEQMPWFKSVVDKFKSTFNEINPIHQLDKFQRENE